MGHVEIENRTPFAAEAMFSFDERGHPVVVPIIKGSFVIRPGLPLALAEPQDKIRFAGKYHGEGRPDRDSLQHEPELAFIKLSTDIVLIGHAHAPRCGTTELDVHLRVGSIATTVHVVGDRTWEHTRPRPFESMPLTYERAYGGWDRSDFDARLHECEPRNPIGVGFRRLNTRKLPGHFPLPNLEATDAPILGGGPRVRPVGFGFISADWEPRRSLAGTYDEAWQQARAPRLPADFDRRFFNAAPPELIAPGFLRGDEPVQAVHASSVPHLSFRLPGVAPPRVRLFPRRGAEVDLVSNLDTVVLDLDRMMVQLTWRALHTLRNGPHDVSALAITSDNVDTLFPPRPPTRVVPTDLSRPGSELRGSRSCL